MEMWPELTGMIGANNHDQLSQVSMREMIYWMDEYGYEYEIDARPPLQPKKFKSYKNILSVRTKKNPKIWTHAITRIMSAPNPLRGTEFTWYWMDETRDTPENTHDVILSRMRESRFRRGLITSTTNAEDWCYKRFVNCRRGQRLYGSMHVPTIESVKRGIITDEYYQTLRSTYSELMAMQELDALHVNVRGGRAYYSFGPWNEAYKAPWGSRYPDKRAGPLIVGCDFNYAPAPCVWIVGQIGGPDGKHIHWFGEISMTEASTEAMTMRLIDRYGLDFHYRIFGDSSGKRGTTSNAGRHDYAQMQEVMFRAGAQFTIDADQANPRVKFRVENMNRLAKNALGKTHMTYDPNQCPHFHSDIKVVGWKNLPFTRTERLDNMGDINRTHASDAAGYACFKLFPPAYHAFMPTSMPSPLVTETGESI